MRAGPPPNKVACPADPAMAVVRQHQSVRNKRDKAQLSKSFEALTQDKSARYARQILQLKKAVLSSSSPSVCSAGRSMEERMSESFIKGAQVPDNEAILKAASVINQQQALLGELQSAHKNAVKIAAALVEAATLARDGAIGPEDILDHARRSIANDSVKISSAEEIFDLSPGKLDGPEQSAETGSTPTMDPLTATLRELGSQQRPV